MAKRKVLNVAVIGLGVGRGHAKAYKEYERSNLAAVCDSDPLRMAERAGELGVPEDRRFSDYRKLLGQAESLGLDAVDIALPNVLHAPVVLDAFRSGLHVLCEKPMAMNAKLARSMIAASRKARKKLMINLSYRFTEQSQALKRVADSGVLGDIYFGKTMWHRRRGIPKFGGWFGQKALAGGGPIIDLGVHRMDLALWLMGSPRPVTVSGSTYGHLGSAAAKLHKKKFDVEDLGCALIRLEGGATLILEASWAGFSEKKEDMLTHLYGTQGGIIQRNVAEGYQFEAVVYGEKDGAVWEQRLQQTLTAANSAYRDFVDAVLDDRPVPASGEDGLRVQLILDAIYQSAALGREVRIPRSAYKT